MLRAGSSPGSRPAAPVLGWLVPTVVMAATAALAASLVSVGARAGVLWCGLVGTVAVALVAAEVVRRGRLLAGLREQLAEQEAELLDRLARQEAETVLLAKVTLPEAIGRLQHGEFPEDVLRTYEHEPEPEVHVVDQQFEAARLAVLRSVLEAVDNEEAMRESAQRAFVNIARRVQAIVHRQALDLREMEDRHGNVPAVFDDLLRLDHGNALIGRLADSIAVLGGARPGRQWGRAVALYSVLRGGMSRILDYQRVELHPVSQVAVVGPAVEPLIHAVAELLDNATRYSPPHTRVHLTAVEVQTGIAIEIEDGGLSLSEEGRARAERMLREAQAGIDLNDLGETPRLGLAVVGRLAQAYGFQVSLRPSAYGGVRAVLIVPQTLITTVPATGRAHGIGVASGPRPATSSRSRLTGRLRSPQSSQQSMTARTTGSGPSFGSSLGSAARSGPMDDDYPVVTERAANGLPQRRRRGGASSFASGSPVSRAPEVPRGTEASRGTEAPRGAGTSRGTGASRFPQPAVEPVQPGMWLAAFHEGVNGQAPSPNAAGHTSEETSDETSGKGDQ
ncbi:ATP-binding protein [Kitasatospora sp. LaBMicrA B282]|uniref:ATP-binding protein n=1 Tax=Kitasatospora sp. LaBMicrA B282 TaxID=3420949 RepID=UPI003D099E2F